MVRLRPPPGRRIRPGASAARPRPPPRLPRRPPAGAAVRPGAARSAGTVVESPALPPFMGYSSSAALIIWYTYFVTNPNRRRPDVYLVGVALFLALLGWGLSRA